MAEIPMADLMPNISGVLLGARASGAVESRALVCSIGWLGLADGCWKYLFEMDSGRSRLFDVCDDPGESRDRAGELPDRVSSYRTRVREWAAAQKDAIKRR